MKDSNYYVKCYLDKIEKCLKEAQSNEDANELFEDTCNAEEIAGYYICNEGASGLKIWRENTEHIKNKSDTDIIVTSILEELYNY